MQQDGEETERMVGWVLCRLRHKSDDDTAAAQAAKGVFGDASDTMSHRIVDLVYGALSNSDFPPASHWIFLAKGI